MSCHDLCVNGSPRPWTRNKLGFVWTYANHRGPKECSSDHERVLAPSRRGCDSFVDRLALIDEMKLASSTWARRRDLIEWIPRPSRYSVTHSGLCTALCFHHTRAPRPTVAVVLEEDGPNLVTAEDRPAPRRRVRSILQGLPARHKNPTQMSTSIHDKRSRC